MSNIVVNTSEANRYVNAYNKIENSRQALKSAEVDQAVKRIQKALKANKYQQLCPEYQSDLDILAKARDSYGDLLVKTDKATKSFNKNGHAPLDIIPKWMDNIYKKLPKLLRPLLKNPGKGLALALAAGNVGKEIVGTAFYTLQALTNEDIPKDKRKFVGMYDLFVGLVSTTFSAVFGFGAISLQDNLIKKGLKKYKDVSGKYPKYAAAFAGLAFLIPNLLQTIIGKRIVAPAIATPIAGRMKEKMMAKADAKNAVLEGETQKETIANKAEQTKEVPLTDRGYVDLRAYIDSLKEQQK